MSGNWIKMSVDLRTHPKVVRMAATLKADRLRVVGGLHAVWSIFDAHSTDGLLVGYTREAIDADLGWRGFSRAMEAVGWLEFGDDGVRAPRFEEHNGATAKRRAAETRRKASSRNTHDGRTKAERLSAWEADNKRTESGQMSASDADKKRAREEKRRIETPEAHPTVLETPPGEHQPLALAEAKLDPETPAAILASVCVANGIKATAFHPVVVEWVRDGFTVDGIKAAIAKARMRKGEASIPVAYLDPILRDDSRPIDSAWRQDDCKAEALARELGIKGAKTGEDRNSFHARIDQALAERARSQVA